MSNFREMTLQWLKKTFKLLKYEHIIYSFGARDLDISKFRNFISTLRKFATSVFAHISAKFKYLNISRNNLY